MKNEGLPRSSWVPIQFSVQHKDPASLYDRRKNRPLSSSRFIEEDREPRCKESPQIRRCDQERVMSPAERKTEIVSSERCSVACGGLRSPPSPPGLPRPGATGVPGTAEPTIGLSEAQIPFSFVGKKWTF